MSGGIQTHLLLCARQHLGQDDLGGMVMGEVQGRDHQLHEVRSVLVVAYVHESGKETK